MCLLLWVSAWNFYSFFCTLTFPKNFVWHRHGSWVFTWSFQICTASHNTIHQRCVMDDVIGYNVIACVWRLEWHTKSFLDRSLCELRTFRWGYCFSTANNSFAGDEGVGLREKMINRLFALDEFILWRKSWYLFQFEFLIFTDFVW